MLTFIKGEIKYNEREHCRKSIDNYDGFAVESEAKSIILCGKTHVALFGAMGRLIFSISVLQIV